jgi:N-acetylneuraminate synthase
MPSEIAIPGRRIGLGHPCYVVAELSANHNQSFDRAVEVVRAAAAAGADAIKLQTYTADTLTLDCDTPPFQLGAGSPWAGRTLHELYSEAYTPWDWHPRLQRVARDLGLDFFSTPFDDSAVDLLERLVVPLYKIASFELVDLPLLRRVAATGKPLVLSTGMATQEEIREAVDAVRAESNDSIVLLKCTSSYPAHPEEMNLRAIPAYRETFDVPVGLSDHTLGVAVPIAAIALGACLIEKHLTLSRRDPGPDSSFSLEPAEFRAMVEAVRVAQAALGSERVGESERAGSSRAFRRSLFVVRDVAAGEVFSQENVRSIRPADGLAPKHLGEVLGHRANCDIARGTPLSWDLVAGAAD